MASRGFSFLKLQRTAAPKPIEDVSGAGASSDQPSPAEVPNMSLGGGGARHDGRPPSTQRRAGGRPEAAGGRCVACADEVDTMQDRAGTNCRTSPVACPDSHSQARRAREPLAPAQFACGTARQRFGGKMAGREAPICCVQCLKPARRHRRSVSSPARHGRRRAREGSRNGGLANGGLAKPPLGSVVNVVSTTAKSPERLCCPAAANPLSPMRSAIRVLASAHARRHLSAATRSGVGHGIVTGNGTGA